MSERAQGTWVELPVERIAVRVHPERGPVQLKVTFHDGTRRVVAVNPEADDPPVLEEILCGKARLVEESVPSWWG